jgi:hypothetical protein
MAMSCPVSRVSPRHVIASRLGLPDIEFRGSWLRSVTCLVMIGCQESYKRKDLRPERLLAEYIMV